MYKIDAHNHPDFMGMTFTEIINNMNKYGIDKCCFQPLEASPYFEGHPNDLLYSSPLDNNKIISFSRCWDYYEKAPERVILAYTPDPRQIGAEMKMRSAIETYGVKVCGEFKFRMMYDNPDAIDLFHLCGEYGVPVVLHIDIATANPSGSTYPRKHYWYGGDIDTVERVLKLCPITNFLLHAPGFWAYISNDELGKTHSYPTGPVIPGGKIERMLEYYPNLYCDCSGDSGLFALKRDASYTKKLFETHPNRFVFARDGYNNELSEYINSLGLPESILENFYHANFESLIRA